MEFIGQSHIMRELGIMLPQIYDGRIPSIAFLVRGPSGYGKTRMCLQICNFLTDRIFVLKLGNVVTNDFRIDERYRVHFIDEIHMAPSIEVLYPIIDSNRFVLLFATNDVARLPEAFVNRCHPLTFGPYTQEELLEISYKYLGIELPETHMNYVIDCGGGNIRIIERICNRIRNLVTAGVPVERTNLDEFKELLDTYLSIRDGMDILQNRYLSALHLLGGVAGIDTLSSYLRVDKNTLMSEVEPVLLYKGLIQLTPRGRRLNDSKFRDS